VPPSCEAEGYTQYVCSCGDAYTDNVVAPTGHTWSAWETTIEPTIEEEGEQIRTCQGCDAFETQQLEKLPEPHLHGYVGQIVSATCTEDGHIRYTCSCGDSYTEFLSPAMGHSYVSSIVEPTCLTAGYTAHTCRCGDRYEDGHTDALGHDFSDYTSNGDATCTQDGTKTAKCSRCDETSTVADPGSATGHTWNEWETDLAAGCLTAGTEIRFCSICDAQESRDTEALGHLYQSEITEPTCTAEGFTTHICVSCGHQMTDTETAALGHSFTSYISNGDATCTKDGTKTATCDRCAATDTVEDAGSMTEHAYEKTIIAPTCTQQGYSIYRCSCTAEYVSDYVPQADHTWESWETTKSASCTGAGEKQRSCAFCTASETETIDPSGHQYEEEIIAANCKTGGYTLHSCTACDHRVKDIQTEALGHEFKNYKSNGDASCTKDGTKTSKCSRCDETSTVVDPGSATGHTWGAWTIKQEPGCLTSGSKTRSCSSCSEEQSLALSPRGHNYQDIVSAPSCTADGYTEHICTVCDHKESDTKTPALGHSFQNYKSNDDATCIQDGTKTAQCSRCSVTDTVADKSSAKGHSYIDWITTVEATCTAAGTQVQICTACGDEQTRQTSEIPHDYLLTSSQESTTTVPGFLQYDCINCHATYQKTLPLKPPAIETDMCGESLLGKVLPNAPYPEFAQSVFDRTAFKMDKAEAVAAGLLPFPVYGDKRAIMSAFHFPYAYLAQGLSYTVYLDNDQGTASFLCWGSAEDYQKLDLIYQRVYEILAELKIDSSVTQKEAICRINDWICEQKYYEENMSLCDNSTYHSIFGNGAVCHNYAIAFQMLCLGAGIECHYYGSDRMNHAWNKVYFSDGSYYWVDTYWNDAKTYWDGKLVDASVANGVPDYIVKMVRERYLLVTTEELSKDHVF